jgi:DNA-directed RNA polymerase specialized sigma24 family protein
MREEVPEYLQQILQFLPYYRSFAARMMGNYDEAEDLVQSSLVRAIKYPPQNNNHLKGWMLRIMFSERTTAGKRKHNTEVSLENIEKEYYDEDPVRNELSDEVREALSKCESGQLFYDWAVEEISIKELEQKYNLSRSGVFHKITETRKKLQFYLDAA